VYHKNWVLCGHRCMHCHETQQTLSYLIMLYLMTPSGTQIIRVRHEMNWKGCGRKRLWLDLRYNICLEVLGRTTKNLSQNSGCSGRDTNLAPPNTSQKCHSSRQLTRISCSSMCMLLAYVKNTQNESKNICYVESSLNVGHLWFI
jgi:hypothetical protein